MTDMIFSAFAPTLTPLVYLGLASLPHLHTSLPLSLFLARHVPARTLPLIII